MQSTQPANIKGRNDLAHWQEQIKKNIYDYDVDFQHTVQFHFGKNFKTINEMLSKFGHCVVNEIEPLVNENNLAINLPRLEQYNAIGERIDWINHHPSYIEAGNKIYGSHLLAKMAKPGGLSECLALLFLSAHAGEAGHNCPIACSAGIIRVLNFVPDFPNKAFYLKKLLEPSFVDNFTGAQFLTEVQGGSDVGLNAVNAKVEDGHWRIYGEKWFCSNANADLIFITARYDENIPGTKGLALFLIPREWEDKKNHYHIRRLKEKIGTRSMATGEIDFLGAYAIQIGTNENGFHLVMDNVLHLSRLFNTICVLGMARRAYIIAREYAKSRHAFSHAIIDYPLVEENLAKIKVENGAMTAAIFTTIRLQDEWDLSEQKDKSKKLLLRLLVNLQKYLSALWSVEHIHHTLDTLAGNGTIEILSPIPRLLRDAIVCENWEGAHNILRIQVLKDMLKYEIDAIFISYIKDLINQLPSSYQQEYAVALSQLENNIQIFRNEPAELQTLNIKNIVDEMIILFCGLTLLLEALDQKEKYQSARKLDQHTLFWILHLSSNKILHNQEYLELIKKIIS